MRTSKAVSIYEPLECRRMMAADTAVVMGTGGNDTIDVSFRYSGNTVIAECIVNGVTHLRTAPGLKRLLIADLTGNDTYRINRVDEGLRVEVSDQSGNDTMHVRSGGLKGIVHFDARGGDDRLFVQDSGNTTQVSARLGNGNVRYSDTRMITTSSVERFDISAGRGNDRLYVDKVGLGEEWIIRNGEGLDTVTVGNGNLAANVLGKLTVFSDTITLDDRKDGGHDPYRYRENVFTKPGHSKQPMYLYGHVSLYCNSGNNVVEVQRGTTGRFGILGGGGNDTLILGDGDIDRLLKTEVYFDGQAGTDRVIINDAGEFSNRTHVLTNSGYRRDGKLSGSFYGVESIELLAGSGNDRLDASACTIPVTLRGGMGNDTIFGGSANDLLSGGAGNDFIRGNDGNDTVFGGTGDDDVHGGNGDDYVVA